MKLCFLIIASALAAFAHDYDHDPHSVPSTPEPATIALMGGGLVAIGIWKWRKGVK